VSERHLGQTLGKYRIEELIGSGGFAWVYKAFDPELEIHIALKVLKPQFAGDATFEERFRREAATAAKLRHPNIIKIYSVGRHGDAVYFAMDYYPSGLADRLEVSNVLPEEFVIRVGIDVAQALGYAHREGVIHRDIKVDNVLFDAHGNAVVADFGIARAVSGYTGQTGTNMVVGTPQYFAPEQARAKPLDGRADIYSLGVTLYRAATGRLPFEGDDWYEIARQHVEEPPPPPRTINPDLTPGFEAAILHCLQKLPDDRPATGELLSQELAALLPVTLETSAYRTRFTGSEPTVVVRTPTHPSDVHRFEPAKRKTGAAWIAGAMVLAAFAVGILALARWRNADSATPPVRPESTAVVTPLPAVPDTVTVSVDTAAADTVVPARPTVGTVAVTAPENATILFDGREVSTNGSWQADTVKLGEHQVVASLPAPSACPTATESRSVRLTAGRPSRSVTLNPRSCGRLSFNGTPKNARWVLRSIPPSDSGVRRDGTGVPVTDLVLPAGDYLRTITADRCVYYGDTISVQANTITTAPPFRLFCQ
jgi:serine/threonine-protein kinase